MKTLLNSFAFAFKGIYYTFRSQRNFRIHAIALCLTVALGLYLGLSALEWCAVVFAIGFVLSAELFNTAIEKLGDKVAGGKQDRLVGTVKDISAGAVLIAAFTALTVGIIVLFIPLVKKLAGL